LSDIGKKSLPFQQNSPVYHKEILSEKCKGSEKNVRKKTGEQTCVTMVIDTGCLRVKGKCAGADLLVVRIAQEGSPFFIPKNTSIPMCAEPQSSGVKMNGEP
jgi:hypothetical protein